MPERLREITAVPFVQEYVCDNCEEGTMVGDGGIAYMANPTQYQHKCNKCGIVRTFTKQYPVVTYQFFEKPEQNVGEPTPEVIIPEVSPDGD